MKKKPLRDEYRAEFVLNVSFDYNSSINLGINKAKIGLGSHFMFFLAISNFLGVFFDSFFYFYYKNIMKHLLKLIIVKFANYYYFNLYNNIINYLYTRK